MVEEWLLVQLPLAQGQVYYSCFLCPSSQAPPYIRECARLHYLGSRAHTSKVRPAIVPALQGQRPWYYEGTFVSERS